MKQVIKVAGALAMVCGFLAASRCRGAPCHGDVRRFKNSDARWHLLEFRWTNPHVFLRVEGKTKDGDQPRLGAGDE